jgi:kynureninase
VESADRPAEDLEEPWATLAGSFIRPQDDTGRPLAYLAGHSLGLLHRGVGACVGRELDAWGRLGILGYQESTPSWLRYAHDLRPLLAPLLGVRPDEVAILNSLTANLHFLLARFYHPVGARRKILIDRPVFPSDRHALVSQIRWHGGDPASDLIEIGPEPGRHRLDPEALTQAIAAAGECLALVWVGGVNYLTGQNLPLAPLARAAHAVGAPFGVDLAHAIGNVPLALDRDGVDFAVWCSYKYLNGGPGAVGGLHVRAATPDGAPEPMLTGWWGHEETTRFLMGPDFRREAGALGFAVSNVPVLATAPLWATLPLFSEYPMQRLAARREAVITFLEGRLAARPVAGLSCITPEAAAERGAQLSFRVGPPLPEGADLIRALGAFGIVGDWREPNIHRIAFAPLYNGFEDAVRWHTAMIRLSGGSGR